MSHEQTNPNELTFKPITGQGACCQNVPGLHTGCQHEHPRLGQHHPDCDAVCLDRVSFRYPQQRSEKPLAGNGAASGNGKSTANPSDVLREVTLHVERGVNLGIIGPNGGGKSTLIKIIVGLLTNYRGSVRIQGLTPAQACRKGDVIGYVPQRMDVEWKFPVTAEQVVLMGLTGKTGLFRRLRKDDREFALEMMRRVGVADLRHKTIGELSGGQQQRVFIARALAPRCKVLVLDEPLSAVDEAGQQQVIELIRELHAALQLTIIMVSHDIAALAAGCNRVACLKHSIHYHDTPSGLTREVLQEVFAHDVAAVLQK